MSDSVQPHRRQPTRLPGPWDSPGKNTGVGCHFLLQCMKVKSESEVAQSCPTLSNLMDCSHPGSPVHGIFQARVLEWGAIAFSVTRDGQPTKKIFSDCPSLFSFYHLKMLRSLSLEIFSPGCPLYSETRFPTVSIYFSFVSIKKKLIECLIVHIK